MINQDVIDLYNRVPAGAKVIVMNRDGSMPTGLTLPPPQPARAKPAPAPAAAPAPVVTEPLMPELPPVPVLDPELIAPSPVVVPAAAPAATTVAPVTAAPAAAPAG
jgi:hypothetical protein